MDLRSAAGAEAAPARRDNEECELCCCSSAAASSHHSSVTFFHLLSQVSSAVAPLFKPPVASVKIDLGKIKPSNTFLTQLPQSARSPRGKKRREKSGFLTDRGGASSNRAGGGGKGLDVSEMMAKALASAGGGGGQRQ
jgi:hypothetical protein